MSDLAACPLGYCTIREPHSHPQIGEGLFGPNAHQEELRQDRAQTAAGGLGRLKVELVKVPCHCPRCHTRFEGLAFTPLAAGETERTRYCEVCAEMAESKAVVRTKVPDLQRPVRTARGDE